MSPNTLGKILTIIGGIVSALLVAAVLTGATTLRDHENKIAVIETKLDTLIHGQERMLDVLERIRDNGSQHPQRTP